MAKTERAIFFLTAMLLFLSVLALAQGPSSATAPQIVTGRAGAFEFVSILTFQNAAAQPCNVQVRFHRGAGLPSGAALRANGTAVSNDLLNVVVPPRGFNRVRLTSTQLFEGAATMLDACGTLQISAGYDIINAGPAAGLNPQAGTPFGSVGEVFNYDPSEGIMIDNITASTFTFDPLGSDGTPNVAGLAVVGDPNAPFPQGTLLCQVITDMNDQPLTNTRCDNYNGEHKTFNLPDLFPNLPGSTEDRQWRVWLNMPPATKATAQQRRLFPLVIDVNGPDQFRQAPIVDLNLNCGPTDLCLNDNRFKVNVTWTTGTQQGGGIPQPLDDDSGLFFFPQLGNNNFELLLNVINGCAFNGHFWVFAAATTDVEYNISVTDTISGQSKTYHNPLGQPAPAITDTAAFATCP